MKKTLLLTILSSVFAIAQYSATISPITPQIKARMLKGNSYKAGCPVKLNDLRYLNLKYIGFDNKEHMGELVVNKSVANDVKAIFQNLYNIKYPIRKMQLVSNYGGSDFDSIEADNTSAFNCRFVDGTTKWSNHAYGKAIDINPLENPYVSKNGHTSHKSSYKYLTRAHLNSNVDYRALIVSNDKIVKIFKKYGWRWGGDWRCCKDYQHFDKNKK